MKNRTSGGVAGGERHGPDGMAQTSPQHFKPMYPDVTDSQVDRGFDLQALVARCARHYLDTCPDLTPAQKQLLRDLERGRYQFKALSQLLEIAPSAANPLALSEALRGATLLRLPAQPQCVIDAFSTETTAQAEADVMQSRFLYERTPGIRDAALDKIGPHLVQLQRFSDLLHRWNPTSKRIFA